MCFWKRASSYTWLRTFGGNFPDFENKTRWPTVPGRRLSCCLAAHLTFIQSWRWICLGPKRVQAMFSSKSKKSSRTKWSAVLQKRVAVSPVSRVWGTNDLCKIEHHTIHVISCHHSWSKGPAKLHGYIQIQIHVSSSLLPKICWFESSNQLHLVGAVAACVDAWLGTGPSRQEEKSY